MINKYYELIKMDKRTANYKRALNKFKNELKSLEDARAFLLFFADLTKEEKKTILKNAGKCYLTYVHEKAGTIEELKPIKEGAGVSWRVFNAYALKVCVLINE